ncbi:MAG: transferase hexapeptide repeat containing protein [Verrucomicrobiaceae bacterium]|nr:transferase hexapeptide repeat containing protein [Verrucomicrobiaceae bacterium]
MEMTWNELKHCIKADLYRYEAGLAGRHWRHALRFEPGFRLTLLMRLCRFTRLRPWLRWTLYLPLRFWFNRLSMKLMVFMDPLGDIGPGLYLGHPFMIVINWRVKIGCDCAIGHEVTLGSNGRGEKKGCPELGNRVYVGPGAKVIGAIKISDCAAIGANAVVTHDVPENGVAVGIPARVISSKGSAGYVTNTLDELDQR